MILMDLACCMQLVSVVIRKHTLHMSQLKIKQKPENDSCSVSTLEDIKINKYPN